MHKRTSPVEYNEDDLFYKRMKHINSGEKYWIESEQRYMEPREEPFYLGTADYFSYDYANLMTLGFDICLTCEHRPDEHIRRVKNHNGVQYEYPSCPDKMLQFGYNKYSGYRIGNPVVVPLFEKA